MSTDHVHTCVYFDDGEPELLCVCGAGAMVVIEDPEDGHVVVALLDERVPELAASA